MPKRRNIAQELGLHLPLPSEAQLIYDRATAAADAIKRDRMIQPITCSQWVIGIDPGINLKEPGAIAFVPPSSSEQTIVRDNPRFGNLPHFETMQAMLKPYKKKNAIACIEQQWARPSDSASSMVLLGASYGGWIALLVAAGIPYEIVSPQKWKFELGLTPGGGKEESVDLCKHLDPGVRLKFVKHHGRAEARLIAEYMRRRIASDKR